MTRTFPCAVLFVGLAFLAVGVSRGDEKKAGKWEPAVEFTDKAGKTWLLKEAKVGAKLSSDRDYLLSKLPKEVVGGTYVLRPHDEAKWWLADASVSAKKDGMVYALIQTKYLGKEVFDEVNEALLERDGWQEVEGKTATTFPSGEGWEWKAYKKDVTEGPVILQLEKLKWNNDRLVLFVFK